VLEEAQALNLAVKFHKSLHLVYIESLKQGITPYRYIRNIQSISVKEQLKLALSKVSVVGAGGLGGHVLLLLSRIGIGHIVVVDNDVFDETNLNRQPLSSSSVIGQSKVKITLSLIESINPGIKLTGHRLRIDSSNANKILADSDVIVDALDNISDRFILEDSAKDMGIPMVHGAVAGFEGQIMSIFPDDSGLKQVYGERITDRASKHNPESVLGVPPLAPALVASLQSMEVIKILLNRGAPLRDMMAYIDLENGQINKFLFNE
jgi:molybdopterin/thiamine biosynthesis adenylyltransferase